MKKQVKKVPAEKAPKPEERATPKKTLACLVGDENLVKEYSAEFQKEGISVVELKSLSSLKSSAKKITIAFELSLTPTSEKKKNLSALDESLEQGIPIVTCSVTETALMQAQEIVHKERLIGIAAFPALIENKLVELAPSLYTKDEIVESVKSFFQSGKKETSLVRDSVGMVMPRILCQVINESLFTAHYDIAQPKDIDLAMRLGAHFPHGPIELGEKIGFKNITAVLDAMLQNFGEEKYRSSPLLRQMAVAGEFWKQD